ncbi:unnamed protein product [Plutella xylostella]|uniref:Small ribosomal subunit protein mS31 n=1 Tax=Plutella xylostella TaxID=51655 RepID=A0A8S4GAG5_PLUXY|nr:unnamed protein product [Plutella xylostella]
MLSTRLALRRDFRIFTRCLSDKSSDADGKLPDVKKGKKALENSDKNDDSIAKTEKIQNLLKNMMVENKLKDNEYREMFATAPEVRKKRQQKPDEIEVKTEQIEESLTEAAGQVAQAIGGDVKQTEAELLSKVLGKINQSSTSLSDLILGMKVDRSKDTDGSMEPETRGQQVKRFVSKAKVQREDNQNQRYSKDSVRSRSKPTAREPRSASQPTKVDIFSGEPLGIFTTKSENYGTTLEVWEALKQRELTLATAQPPANYFQKMALWTKQGKVWKFPIDNEQGLEEENDVHFSEHIFLDAHLDGWCPSKGPIRHFMELVCVGLSKNPFYTVKEKRDHILWYKEYFESKKAVLTEVGAWPMGQDNKETQSP